MFQKGKGTKNGFSNNMLVWNMFNSSLIKKMSLSDCNWSRIHKHLVHKQTLSHLTKLAKSVDSL